MTENKNKNFDEILSEFFTPDQAEQIKKDFSAGDGFFEKYPAPAPAQQMLADIKQKMNHRLEKQKRINWPTILLKTAAVAAIVVIVSAILTNFSNRLIQPAQNESPASVWQKTDTNISSYEAEIKQLKNELTAINFGEEKNGTNGILSDRVEKIETETIEMENSFWKG